MTTQTADAPRRGKTHPPSKNRVWDFFQSAHSCTQENWQITQCSRPENQPTPTATASGVPYYGYRYYSPQLGRWPSRDPMEEEGGLNQYGFCANNPTSFLDILGLAYLEFSPDPIARCDYAYSWDVRVANVGLSRDVRCVCDCWGDEGWRVSCGVEISMDIKMNGRFETQNYVGGHTKAGAYGHEQKHMESVKHYLETIVIPELEGKEIVYDRESLCTIRARMAASRAETQVDLYWLAETIEHAHAPIGPEASTPYMPVGGWSNVPWIPLP